MRCLIGSCVHVPPPHFAHALPNSGLQMVPAQPQPTSGVPSWLSSEPARSENGEDDDDSDSSTSH